MNPPIIYGWKGLELIAGPLSVGITPSVGGRIMSLKYKGHELLFHDAAYEGQTVNPNDWPDPASAKMQLGFRLWGGDKTWVAPEREWLLKMPSVDLDSGPYELRQEPQGVSMVSPVCRETGVQIVRYVAIENGGVRLTETLFNRTEHPLSKGLWNVTMVQQPCRFLIPSKDFRSYHHEDPTLLPYEKSLHSDDALTEIDCLEPTLFKIGGMVSRGEIKILCQTRTEEICWTKRFDLPPKDAVFAHGSMVEVYNSPNHPYAEIEIHAPLKVLNPGEHVSLTQHWEIHPCSSKN